MAGELPKLQHLLEGRVEETKGGSKTQALDHRLHDVNEKKRLAHEMRQKRRYAGAPCLALALPIATLKLDSFRRLTK
ncbi:hypothetical protein VNO77_01650 [Canavalia gladiata]|uniref:Uncharacterized protein n=1 Tax=Canavalia gladiata TaxID=3824 RepID=A0AAN9R561_CANGL